MRYFRLAPDYHCWPLWHNGANEVGNIDPQNLPISRPLVDDLNTWAYEFDATLNMDDPASSGFKTEDDEIDFKKRGVILAGRLRAELGSEFCIEYHCA